MTWMLVAQALILVVQLFLIIRTRDHTRRQAEEQVSVHARLCDLEQHQIRVPPSSWGSATHLVADLPLPDRHPSGPVPVYGPHRPRHLKEIP